MAYRSYRLIRRAYEILVFLVFLSIFIGLPTFIFATHAYSKADLWWVCILEGVCLYNLFRILRFWRRWRLAREMWRYDAHFEEAPLNGLVTIYAEDLVDENATHQLIACHTVRLQQGEGFMPLIQTTDGRLVRTGKFRSGTAYGVWEDVKKEGRQLLKRMPLDAPDKDTAPVSLNTST